MGIEIYVVRAAISMHTYVRMYVHMLCSHSNCMYMYVILHLISQCLHIRSMYMYITDNVHMYAH